MGNSSEKKSSLEDAINKLMPDDKAEYYLKVKDEQKATKELLGYDDAKMPENKGYVLWNFLDYNILFFNDENIQKIVDAALQSFIQYNDYESAISIAKTYDYDISRIQEIEIKETKYNVQVILANIFNWDTTTKTDKFGREIENGNKLYQRDQIIDFNKKIEQIEAKCSKQNIEEDFITTAAGDAIKRVLKNINLMDVHKAPDSKYLNSGCNLKKQIKNAYRQCIRYESAAKKWGYEEERLEFQKIALQLSMKSNIEGMTLEGTIRRFGIDDSIKNKVIAMEFNSRLIELKHYYSAFDFAESNNLGDDLKKLAVKGIIEAHVYDSESKIGRLNKLAGKYDLKDYLTEVATKKYHEFIKNRDIDKAQELNGGYELNLKPDKKLMRDIRETRLKEISDLLRKRHYSRLLNVAKSYHLDNYEPATPYIKVAKVMVRR